MVEPGGTIWLGGYEDMIQRRLAPGEVAVLIMLDHIESGDLHDLANELLKKVQKNGPDMTTTEELIELIATWISRGLNNQEIADSLLEISTPADLAGAIRHLLAHRMASP